MLMMAAVAGAYSELEESDWHAYISKQLEYAPLRYAPHGKMASNLQSNYIPSALLVSTG